MRANADPSLPRRIREVAHGNQEALSLEKLRDLIERTTAPSKADLPLLKLARFGEKRTGDDCLRLDDNLIEITGIELDYDGEEMPFEKAVETIERADLSALLYTSPSYTKEKPRWRILLPTSEPLPPARRWQLAARVNGLFDGRFESETFALSQSTPIFGKVKGAAFKMALCGNEFTGDCIDERPDLYPEAMGPPAKGQKPTKDPKIDWDAVEKEGDWWKSPTIYPSTSPRRVRLSSISRAAASKT